MLNGDLGDSQKAKEAESEILRVMNSIWRNIGTCLGLWVLLVSVVTMAVWYGGTGHRTKLGSFEIQIYLGGFATPYRGPPR